MRAIRSGCARPALSTLPFARPPLHDTLRHPAGRPASARQIGGGIYNEWGHQQPPEGIFHPTNTTVCFNTVPAPYTQYDNCISVSEDARGTMHYDNCTGLNPCPAAPLYVCNTDFLCEVAAPGQPGAESLAQCNATCHRGSSHPPEVQPLAPAA